MPIRRWALLLSLVIAAASQAAASGAQVDGVYPSAGLIVGGSRVRIEGAGFSAPMKVWLGQSPCGNVRVLSSDELECVTSPHPAGTVDLLLRTAREFVIRPQLYTYVPDLRLSPAFGFVQENGKMSFRAAGGSPPYSFSVVQGAASIAPGSGDPASGSLSVGSQFDAGVVKVTDSLGDWTAASYQVTIPLKVDPDSPQVLASHTVSITAYGGAPPYKFDLESGDGRFFPDRRVYVAPSSAGSAVIRVTDANQQSVEVKITIQDPPALAPHVVAVGDGFSCAAPAGAVSCWGSNGSDQLGVTRAESVNVSTPVEDLQSGVVSIVSGIRHTCVLVNGGVKCWGANEFGQLGDGTTRSSSEPRQVIGLESGVLGIAAGDFHTCAALANSVVCWGKGDSGQLGDGIGSQSAVPVAVTGFHGPASALAAGGTHTCAVLRGALSCWGGNRNGQLGTGNQIDQWTAVSIAALSSDVRAVSAGRAQTCAASASALKCWGFNGSGNIGASTASSKSKPYDVDIPSPVSVLASREYHSCAITSGSLYCWGYNYGGQVGDSSYLNRWAPVRVEGFNGPVRDVATSAFHSCAVTAQNQVYCWGDDFYGQLGDGGSARQVSPVRVIDAAEKREIRRKARLKRGTLQSE